MQILESSSIPLIGTSPHILPKLSPTGLSVGSSAIHIHIVETIKTGSYPIHIVEAVEIIETGSSPIRIVEPVKTRTSPIHFVEAVETKIINP